MRSGSRWIARLSLVEREIVAEEEEVPPRAAQLLEHVG
jgi:hypothetical protein